MAECVSTYFHSFMVFSYTNLVMFGPVLMNTLDTKCSKKFTGCKDRTGLFKGAFSKLLRKQNKTKRQVSQHGQARRFSMTIAGSHKLFNASKSSA